MLRYLRAASQNARLTQKRLAAAGQSPLSTAKMDKFVFLTKRKIWIKSVIHKLETSTMAQIKAKNLSDNNMLIANTYEQHNIYKIIQTYNQTESGTRIRHKKCI